MKDRQCDYCPTISIGFQGRTVEQVERLRAVMRSEAGKACERHITRLWQATAELHAKQHGVTIGVGHD